MVDERWYGNPPPSQRAKPKHGRGLLGLLILLAVPVLSVGTYVMLQRLSDEVLTIIAVVGCAGGMAIPVLFVAVIILLRRAESNGRGERMQSVQPTMTQPTVFVVPPTALPLQQSQPQMQTLWEQQPATRTFTIVGDGPG